MSIPAFFQQLTAYMNSTVIQVLISLGLVLFYIIATRRIVPLLYQTLANSNLREGINKRAYLIFRLLSVLVLAMALCVVWGIEIRGLLVLASSVIAVVGVALFAAWSLVSNVTAFFILLGQKTYSEGKYIRIMDGGHFVEGKIIEINMFSTILKTTANEKIVYPNNLVISRPVIVAPNDIQNAINKEITKTSRWKDKRQVAKKTS